MTYYVANTPGIYGGVVYGAGSDSNTTAQAQSPATPWLTIEKAYANMVGGDSVYIGSGTYLVNTSANYWLLNRTMTSMAKFIGATGNPADVVVTSAAGTSGMIRSTSGGKNGDYHWFESLTLQPTVNGGLATVWISDPTSCHDMTFKNCVLQNGSLTNSMRQCVYILTSHGGVSTGDGVYNITFDSCVFQDADASHKGAVLNISAVDPTTQAPPKGIVFRNCTSTCSEWFTAYNYCTDSSFTGIVSRASNGHAFALGEDGPGSANPGTVCHNVTVSNCYFESATGHGCIFGGAGVDGTNTIRNLYIVGGNQGLVLKEAHGAVVTDVTIDGKNVGVIGALYLKAATNTTVKRFSVIESDFNTTGAALEITYNPTSGNKPSGNSVTQGRVITYGAGRAIFMDSAGNDGGSNQVDQLVYDVRGSGSWGSVRGTTVTSLATIQAAWSGYTPAGNDALSVGSGDRPLLSYRHSASGAVLYATIQDSNGRFWNGSAFEVFSSSSYYKYCLFALEEDPGYCWYSIVVPWELPGGVYTVSWIRRNTYLPSATGDTPLSSRSLQWSGTNVPSLFDIDPALIAATVWNALLTGITTAGSVGKLLKDNINAAIDTRMATFSYTAPDNTGVAAIQERTDNLPDDPASETSIATIPLAVWNILKATAFGATSIGAWLVAQITAIAQKTGTIGTGGTLSVTSNLAPGGNTLTIRRGDSLLQTFDLPADASDYSALWLALKESDAQSDAEATAFVSLSSGLEVLNGAAAIDPSLADLSAVGTVATLVMDSGLTGVLQGAGHWGLKAKKAADSTVVEVYAGPLNLTQDVVRAI